MLEESENLKEKKELLLNEKVTLEALQEMTELPMERIQEISNLVKKEYESRPARLESPKSTMPIFVRIILLGILVFLIYFIAMAVRDGVLNHQRNLKAQARYQLERNYIKLLEAVKADNLDMVMYHIVEEGIPVEIDDPEFPPFRTTALIEAVTRGFPEITRYLLAEGANPMRSNHEGKTVMDLADEGSNIVIPQIVNNAILQRIPQAHPVKELNTMGIHYSRTAFLKALEKNDKKALELFLEADAGEYLHNYEALGIPEAAKSNNLEVLALLVEKGKDIEQQVFDKALVLASGEGHIGIIDYLLAKGVDINLHYDLSSYSVEQAFTPLIQALWEESPATEHLLKNGADPDQIGTDYDLLPLEVPMYLVDNYIEAQRRSKQVKLLLDYGADVNKKDGDGNTALDFAWKLRGNESPYFVRILLDAGAEVPKTEFAFRELIFLNDVKRVKELLDFGVNPDLQGFEYYDEETSALIKSVMLGNEEMAGLLLDYGADVNYQTPDYRKTPLLMAVINEDLSMVRMLFEHGARVNQDVLNRLESHYRYYNSGNKGEIKKLVLLHQKS